MGWFSCNDCEKEKELDYKIKQFEFMQKQMRIIDRDRLSRAHGHYHKVILLHNIDRLGTDIEIETAQGETKVMLRDWEAKILRDFLNEHYPVKKVEKQHGQ